MNKTKQEMLVIVEALREMYVENYGHDTNKWNTLRTLITDSVILSEGEIDGMKWANAPEIMKGQGLAVNKTLEKIKEMK